MRLKIKARVLTTLVWGIVLILILASVPAPLRAVGNQISGAPDLAMGGSTWPRGHADGQVICQIKPGRSIGLVARRHNLEVRQFLEDNTYLMKIPWSRTVEQAADSLRDDPNVAWAGPNYLVQVPEVTQRSVAWVDQRSVAWVDGKSPTDYFSQSAMSIIRAKWAQAIADGSGVTVAVIDTGVDVTHPTFKNIARGYDFVDDDINPMEVGNGIAYGHGTMVAGIIALVAPEARIMPLRAFTSDGLGRVSDVSQAIRYAARNGARVINMSFGMTDEFWLVRSAIAFASSLGVTLIASAGNDNSSIPHYPASDDEHVLAVAATNNADVKADFSNYGLQIDVCAPGVSIYSAYPGGQFAWWSGTSFAAPFVSGEAALVLSVRWSRAGEIIEATAVNIDRKNPGYRGLLGSGRIDCLAAVRY